MARAIDGTWNSFLLNLSYLTLNDFQENKAGLNTLKTAVESQPTLTPPNEQRMINADKLAKRIAGHSNYHGDSILAAIYCAAEGKENDAPIRPIENTPNEPLTCEGCIHEHNEHENCNYCIRAPYLCDYYHRRPPEGEDDA